VHATDIAQRSLTDLKIREACNSMMVGMCMILGDCFDFLLVYLRLLYLNPNQAFQLLGIIRFDHRLVLNYFVNTKSRKKDFFFPKPTWPVWSLAVGYFFFFFSLLLEGKVHSKASQLF
jgi:hypothetical protein